METWRPCLLSMVMCLRADFDTGITPAGAELVDGSTMGRTTPACTAPREPLPGSTLQVVEALELEVLLVSVATGDPSLDGDCSASSVADATRWIRSSQSSGGLRDAWLV